MEKMVKVYISAKIQIHALPQGEEWTNVAAQAYKAREMRKKYELKERMLMDQLKEMSHETQSVGGKFVLKMSIRKGSVEYSKIPELSSIDLDQYRKEESIVWTLKEIHKHEYKN